MSQAGETFFTSVGCMEGRIQAVIAKYGQQKFDAKYPDTITEAGLVGLLSNDPSQELLDSIRKKVLVSVEKHHSKGIIVHGHQECAALDAVDNIHKQNILKAAEIIRSMAPNLIVKPAFVVRGNSGWEVEEL